MLQGLWIRVVAEDGIRITGRDGRPKEGDNIIK
jgi:hypothetical protein